MKEERRKRNVLLEAKLLNENYYIYCSTSRYDRASREAIKVSEYIRIISRRESQRKRMISCLYADTGIQSLYTHYQET